MSMIINTDVFAENFLPPKKRLPRYLAWVRVLLSPLQVLYDTMFGTYRSGNPAADYSLLVTYAIGDQVKYIDKAIYQCYVATTAGILPTDSTYWFKIQDKFVGVEPRTKYNSQRLIFEWALNEWFGTTFVNTPGASDIYIEAVSDYLGAFYAGYDESESSEVVYANNTATAFIQYDNIPNDYINFTIYIPNPVWLALGANTNDRDQVVRNIADLYVYAGIAYTITPY